MQRKDFAAMEELTQQLHRMYESIFVEPIIALDNNVYCCCFIDDTWRRCKVLRLNTDQTCFVLLIDIGLVAKVAWNCLRMLMKDFISTPAFAKECLLLRAASASPILKYSPEENSSFKAKLRHYVDNMYACTHSVGQTSSGIFLYHKDSSDEFNCLNNLFTLCEADDKTTMTPPLTPKRINRSEKEQETHRSHEINEAKGKNKEIAGETVEKGNRFTTRVDCVLHHFDSVESAYISINSWDDARRELHIEVQREGESGTKGSDPAVDGKQYDLKL